MKLYRGMQYMAFAGLLFISACASTPQLSRQDVLQQNDSVAKLDARLANAGRNGSDYLSPEGFSQVNELLEQSVAAAQSSNAKDAKAYADKGLRALSMVEKHTTTSQKLFTEVLANRERAIKAGAAELFTEDFNKLESEFRETTSLVERNRIEAALHSP